MFEAVIESFLSGLPFLLLHFAATMSILALGVGVYVVITPHAEMKLIRDGNVAASISLGGVVVGLAIPLAVTMSNSVNVFDVVLFGVVALVLQLLCFGAVNLILRGLPKRIEDGEISAAIFLTFVKLATALVTAAALSV